jgi:hypothetical protein
MLSVAIIEVKAMMIAKEVGCYSAKVLPITVLTADSQLVGNQADL